MADSDKNILITPNRGYPSEPKIEFVGKDNVPITLYSLDTGSISVEGSSGQLFSISDTFSGTIFSVNDISGIPSIEVFDTGEIRFAEFGGNISVGGVANPQNRIVVSGGVEIVGSVTSSLYTGRNQVAEMGIWSSGVRNSSVRINGPSKMVNVSLEDRSSKYTDGGATAGNETSASLMRESYTIRRNGTSIFMDINIAGTIYTLNMGTAT
jgi:hypothetical protein